MNTQRREEIRAISASLRMMFLNEAANAIDELFSWIYQLEAKAAERVISDGTKGPVPDYAGEGSAWVPPKIKPHIFAQMVNEVRDLAFDFGASEQFRDRVSDLLGRYIHANHVV